MGKTGTDLLGLRGTGGLGRRYGWAAVSGGLLALAYPKTGLAGAAWLAPGLVLTAAIGHRGAGAFRIGYVAGFVFYLASLHWLLFIPFPAGAIAGWLALSAYCALYPAVWVWLSWHCFPLNPLKGWDATETRGQGWTAILERFSAMGWWHRQWWVLSAALLWVALEMVRGRFLSGFPWNLLGVSQYRLLPLIQIAEFTGVYGVSFLVVYFSTSLVLAVCLFLNHGRPSWSWSKEMAPCLILLVAALSFGMQQVGTTREPDRTLKAALIQPSIPQTLIFNPEKDAQRFKKILRISKQALETNPDLLIWPEASLPSLRQEDYQKLVEMLRPNNAWMILGADHVQRNRRRGSRSKDYRYYNAGFLLNGDGKLVEIYHKQRLVIFGEYIPFSDWLPFLKYLTPIQASFSSGKRPVPFHLPHLNARTSPLICFEDLFPQLVRQHAQPEIDFLLNLTNDGWFGNSSAQWQHGANAAFRAVENRLPLVRCTNNGLTCWIDRRGALHPAYFESGTGNKDIYSAGFETFQIPLKKERHTALPTLYTRYGDWFGWMACAITLLNILPGAVRRFGQGQGQGEGHDR